MGKVVKRGKRWFVQNTHNGAVTGKGYTSKKGAQDHLKVLKKKFG